MAAPALAAIGIPATEEGVEYLTQRNELLDDIPKGPVVIKTGLPPMKWRKLNRSVKSYETP